MRPISDWLPGVTTARLKYCNVFILAVGFLGIMWCYPILYFHGFKLSYIRNNIFLCTFVGIILSSLLMGWKYSENKYTAKISMFTVPKSQKYEK